MHTVKLGQRSHKAFYSSPHLPTRAGAGVGKPDPGRAVGLSKARIGNPDPLLLRGRTVTDLSFISEASCFSFHKQLLDVS